VPKSGHVVITKIENLHIDTRKIEKYVGNVWFPQIQPFPATHFGDTHLRI